MGVIQHDFTYGSFYGGISATERFGMVVYGCEGIDEIATRDVTPIVVPGKNGVLHLDNGRWDERQISYLCYVPGVTSDNYIAKMLEIRAFYGEEGHAEYLPLFDTFYPEHFAQAAFAGAMEPEPMAFRTKGLIKITFKCRPERYLISGQETTTFTAQSTAPFELTNPTDFSAFPLIYITGRGTGSVTFSAGLIYSCTINVNFSTSLSEGTSINCETYQMTRPEKVTADVLPVLYPGTTTVTFDGGVETVAVTPRWWTL